MFQSRLADSRKLLDFGLNNFEVHVIAFPRQIMGEIAVKNGKQKLLPIAVLEQVSVVIPVGREDDLELVVVNTKIPTAPVIEGTPVAQLDVQLDWEIIASVELVAATDMKRANIFVRLFRGIGGFFTSLFSGKIF
ncbi:MAG: hypothetical protein KGZ96_04880 [Clostridia bacterium]|nr:hypothetical protein [Clostridia bacterium]